MASIDFDPEDYLNECATAALEIELAARTDTKEKAGENDWLDIAGFLAENRIEELCDFIDARSGGKVNGYTLFSMWRAAAGEQRRKAA